MSTAMNNTQAGLGLNPIMTGIAQGYQNAELVGSTLFRNVPTPARHGQVIQFGKEAFKLYSLKRAPNGAIAQIDMGYKGIPFALEQVAAKIMLPVETTDEAKVIAGVDLPVQALETNMSAIMLEQEYAQATLATTAGNYAGGNVYAPTGTDLWSDPASDPLKAISDAKEVVRSKIGRYPNTLLLSAKVFAALKNHPKLVDRLKYTSAASITTDMIANWCDVAKVVIGAAVFSDDQDNFNDVWGKHAVLAYVPDGPGNLARPAFGYNYVLAGMPAVANAYLNQDYNSWVYNIFYERNAYITSKDSGFLFFNVVA